MAHLNNVIHKRPVLANAILKTAGARSGPVRVCDLEITCGQRHLTDTSSQGRRPGAQYVATYTSPDF